MTRLRGHPERCETCVFWVGKDVAARVRQRHCERLSFLSDSDSVMFNTESATDGGTYSGATVYTYAEFGCSEWEKKPT